MNPTKKYATRWKKNASFAAGAAVLAVAQNGFAALSSGGLILSATMSPGCTALTVVGADFGTYSVGSPDVTVTAGSITVECPLNLPYRIMVNGGQQPRPALSIRRLQRVAATNRITYNLKYAGVLVGDFNSIDFSYLKTAPWANGILGTGDGQPQTYTLSADVLIATSVPVVTVAGIYTDSVAVTLQW